jgi:hypothetical protein
MKPILHVTWAPAAVEVSVAVNPVTGCEVVMVTGAVTGWVSDDVDTVNESDPAVPGLVSSSDTESTSPALVALPSLSGQVTVVPLGLVQLEALTVAPLDESVTTSLPRFATDVPGGSVTVTLPPGAGSAPPAEVVKSTVQMAWAPVAPVLSETVTFDTAVGDPAHAPFVVSPTTVAATANAHSSGRVSTRAPLAGRRSTVHPCPDMSAGHLIVCPPSPGRTEASPPRRKNSRRLRGVTWMCHRMAHRVGW